MISLTGFFFTHDHDDTSMRLVAGSDLICSQAEIVGW